MGIVVEKRQIRGTRKLMDCCSRFIASVTDVGGTVRAWDCRNITDCSKEGRFCRWHGCTEAQCTLCFGMRSPPNDALCPVRHLARRMPGYWQSQARKLPPQGCALARSVGTEEAGNGTRFRGEWQILHHQLIAVSLGKSMRSDAGWGSFVERLVGVTHLPVRERKNCIRVDVLPRYKRLGPAVNDGAHFLPQDIDVGIGVGAFGVALRRRGLQATTKGFRDRGGGNGRQRGGEQCAARQWELSVSLHGDGILVIVNHAHSGKSVPCQADKAGSFDYLAEQPDAWLKGAAGIGQQCRVRDNRLARHVRQHLVRHVESEVFGDRLLPMP